MITAYPTDTIKALAYLVSGRVQPYVGFGLGLVWEGKNGSHPPIAMPEVRLRAITVARSGRPPAPFCAAADA